MKFRPTISPRERILAFGVMGTGKSNAILTVARRCPDDTFYVIDNDNAYARLLATDFTDVENVRVIEVPKEDWDGHLAQIENVIREMGRDDWLVVDMLSYTWDAVQEWYIDQLYAKDIDEYFMDVRRAKLGTDKKALGGMEGLLDWPVVTKLYGRLQRLLINTPGHLYATAELGDLADTDDRNVKALYGPYGVKPKGQKRTGNLMQTVLLFTKSRAGQYQLTTVKDRGRVELEDEPLADFGRDYMLKVAKWRPMKDE